MTRWALVRSRELVSDSSAVLFDQVLGSMPLEKPHDHQGGDEVDCFPVDFAVSVADEVLHALKDTSDSRLLHLRVVWQEYRDAGVTMRAPE